MALVRSYTNIIRDMMALAATCIVVGTFTLVATQWTLNTFTKVSEVENMHVVGEPVTKIGEPFDIRFDAIRYQTCTMDVSRMARRPDGREHQLQRDNVAVTVGPNPPTRVTNTYTIKMPEQVLNPGEDELDVYVFSKGVYLCNWLDNFQRRVKEFPGVWIKVKRN